jgi:hypothetical protein
MKTRFINDASMTSEEKVDKARILVKRVAKIHSLFGNLYSKKMQLQLCQE